VLEAVPCTDRSGTVLATGPVALRVRTAADRATWFDVLPLKAGKSLLAQAKTNHYLNVPSP
jgi:hypothetical protein